MALKKNNQKLQFLTKIAGAFLAILCFFGSPDHVRAGLWDEFSTVRQVGILAVNSAKADLAVFWQNMTCFLGFNCPNEIEAPAPRMTISTASEGFFPAKPDGSAVVSPSQPSSAGEFQENFSGKGLTLVNPPAGGTGERPSETQSQNQTQIIRNIYPAREIQTKEIQTVKTIETKTNTVVADQDLRDQVNQLLRQLDSDRPNYSAGQSVTLPANLGGTTLNIGAGNLTADASGNLTVQGYFTLNGASSIGNIVNITADSASPALTLVQNGAGVALRAGNITLKDSEISTNTADSDLLLNPNGAGQIQFHNTNNYLDANGNLTVSGNILPAANIAQDLGSSTKQFNNIYSKTIYTAAINTSGQGVFNYPPASTAYADAALLINPTTAPANSILLGIGIAGSPKFTVDAEGDLLVGGSIQLNNSGGIIANDYNGLDLTATTTGFTISGGTTRKTLTLDADGSSSNWNTAYGWGNHGAAGYLKADGTIAGATSQAQTFTNGLVAPKLYPASDSTTALQFTKADGSTSVMNVDTTNGRVGIGTTSPQETLDIQGSIKSSALNLSNDYGVNWGSMGDGMASVMGKSTVNGYLDFSVNGSTKMKINGSGNLGVGTTSPEFKLSLDNDGGILAKGTYGSGADLSTSGAGTRLIWYPKKAAFRAGYVDSTQWDNANVGNYSVAMGSRAKASGSGSVALGELAVASGSDSVALGGPTTASGEYSVAMGASSVASGRISFSVGGNVTASGDYSAAMGRFLTAGSGSNTFVLGQGVDNDNRLINNTASSLMVGFNSTIPTLFVGPSSGAGTTGNVGIGTASPAQQLEITQNFRMPSTTNAAQYGIIYKGTTPFIHDFNYGNNGTVTTEGYNTFVGLNAGNLTMGSTASSSTHSSYNTAVGYRSFQSNTTGFFNSAFGARSLGLNTTGSSNSAFGARSLYSNTTGSDNLAIGSNALYSNTTGSDNLAIGSNALYSNTTSDNNIALGGFSLYSNTTGSYNFAFGRSALHSNTTGSYNFALGYDALQYNGTGNNNLAIGYRALSNNTGSSNIALGHDTLFYNTSGYNNSALGYNALHYNTGGSHNSAFGYVTLRYNNGDYNSAFGMGALYSNTTGVRNVALGFEAGRYIAGGSTANQASANSLYLGASTKALADGDTNEIVVGYDATGAGSNSAVLGNDSITKTLLKGSVGIGTTSPSYTLDVNGTVRAQTAITAGFNKETLSGDKTLTPGTDKMYQYLDPNGANRNITLATVTANAGDRFIVRHNGTYTSTYYLRVKQSSTDLDFVYAAEIKEFVFDGTNWVSGENGSGEDDYRRHSVAIGYNTKAYTEGTAVGSGASGYSNGVAVGAGAFGRDYGVAVGYGSYGHYGAVVGYLARGMNYGAAMGYKAGYNLNTSSILYNNLFGAYAGYQLTTGAGNLIMGYQSGYDATYSPTTGSKNILIGYQAGAPANSTSNFLNIGNAIFATGINNSTFPAISAVNVGIGTTAPSYALDIVGGLRAGNATSTSGLVFNPGTGRVGIGTTSPSYALDVNGTVRAQTAITAGFNKETLSGDKTLTPGTDKMYQYLDPNGANRNIALATSGANAGDRFIVRNDGSYSISYYLLIKQSSTDLDKIYAGGVKEFVFDGTNWVSGENGSGENDDKKSNFSVGYEAKGYSQGLAIGYNSVGHSNGVAIGNYTTGYFNGVGIGYQANGYNSGVALGYSAQSSSSGVAVGNRASGSILGVAIGADAIGEWYGVSVGYKAGDNISASSAQKNILLGAYAGDTITTGTSNILLGYDVDVPLATTTDYLSIGNVIFATGGFGTGTSVGAGYVGIGTASPSYLLTMGTGGGFYDQATGAWTNGSDRAYKDNIVDLAKYGLATVNSLRPVAYTVKQSGIEQVGFIAQEVKNVVPELVSGQDGALGLNYGGFAPILVKAIQEQQAQIDNLNLKLNSFGLIDSVPALDSEKGLTLSQKGLTLFKDALAGLGLVVSDGIARVKELVADKMTAKQMCVKGDDGETVCLTKDQLKNLIQNSGSGANIISTPAESAPAPGPAAAEPSAPPETPEEMSEKTPDEIAKPAEVSETAPGETVRSAEQIAAESAPPVETAPAPEAPSASAESAPALSEE